MKTFNFKLLLLFYFASTFFLASCSKDNDQPDCEKNRWGTLDVESGVIDPYSIYIDGAFKGNIAGYNRASYSNISSGTHAIEAIQISGYIFFPNEYSLSVNISNCKTESVIYR